MSRETRTWVERFPLLRSVARLGRRSSAQPGTSAADKPRRYTIPRLALGVGLLWLVAIPAAAQTPIPGHPNDLQYPPMQFKLPAAAELRATLSNGLVVFIAEDRMLPTFDLNVTIRTGSAVEPADRAGLADLTGDQIRDGGTKNLTPEELDEKVDFLAASLSSNIGDTRGSARLSCLSKDIDEGLGLFVEMLRYPRFDEERLRKAKDRMLQNLKRRNDATASISGIEWGFLMNGENHFTNRYSTPEAIKTVTRDDLFAFHRKYFHPGNMILAVAGDFDRAKMLKKLEKAFGDWPVGETGPSTFPAPDFTPSPGVYLVDKKDVNQGRVTVGHKSIVRGSPDEFALMVMNGILGASGFRSRLVAKVRSDEGLAYNTGSRFEQGVYYPEDFTAWFQSKSNSCVYATKIVLDEIKRLQTEKVSDADVADTVSFMVESFPQRFQNKMTVLGAYASDEYTGRDSTYWQTYIDNLKKVKPDDVMRVAKKYLHPDQLVILAVGDADAIFAGGHDKSPDLHLDAFGKVTRLPLRDPETLKR